MGFQDIRFKLMIAYVRFRIIATLMGSVETLSVCIRATRSQYNELGTIIIERLSSSGVAWGSDLRSSA